jgi:hypothetical protein
LIKRSPTEKIPKYTCGPKLLENLTVLKVTLYTLSIKGILHACQLVWHGEKKKGHPYVEIIE